jgi:peptidoglycan/xylan/chitin deacetylase (PgdA/CDA1 family)
MVQSGQFVISLDFELIYGVSHLDNQQYWKESVCGGRIAVDKMLDLFSRYGIHATWACVGMLMANNRDEMVSFFPNKKPEYDYSNYDMNRFGEDEKEDPWHYGGSLVEKIKNTPYQEIGSHTFSHFYCMESGQTIEAFVEDIQAAQRIASKYNIHLRSMVFPKNEVDQQYLEMLGTHGFCTYRGNEACWSYDEKGKDIFLQRVLRMLDTYINVTGKHCYDLESLPVINGVLNVPSSRFLRPYSPALRFAEKMKLSRIKSQMKYAAKKGKLFHLWWHPHNFGMNTNENMENLREILEYYSQLKEKYNFRSCNMAEIAEMK